MSASWYYAVDRKTHGPITEAELHQLALSGKLKPDDLIWCDELPNWTKARDVDGVFVATDSESLPLQSQPSRATTLIACQECGSAISRHSNACMKCGAPNTWVHPEIARFLASKDHFPSLPPFEFKHDKYVLQGWDVRSRNRANATSNLLNSFSLETPLTKKGFALQAATLLGSSFLASCMNESVKAFVIDFSTTPPTYHTTDDSYWRPVLAFFGFQRPQIADIPKKLIHRPLSGQAARGKHDGLIMAACIAAFVLIIVLVFFLANTRPAPQIKPNGIAANNVPVPHVVTDEAQQVRKAQLAENNAALSDADEAENRREKDVRDDMAWQRFKHPSGVAEVDMPGKAVLNRDNSIVPPPTGVTQFSGRPPAEINLDHPANYTAKAADFSCSLQVSKLPPFDVSQIAADPAEFANCLKLKVDLQRDSLKFFNESNTRIISESPVQLGAARGREFLIESPEHMVVARWYMTRTDQFWASIVLPKTRDTTAEREHFFNSLKLVNVKLITGRSATATQPNSPPDPQMESDRQTDQAAKNAKKNSDNPIPEKIREYFERAERIRLSRIKSLESNLDKLQVEVMNARSDQLGSKRAGLKLLQKTLDEVKNFRSPTAPLPLPMEVGDIGFHDAVFYVVIWDERTITANMYYEIDRTNKDDLQFHLKPSALAASKVAPSGGFGPPVSTLTLDLETNARREFIVTNVDAKSLSKIRPDSFGKRIWPLKSFLRVIATSPDEATIQRFPINERERLRDHAVLESLATLNDVEKFRKLFYQELTRSPDKK